MSSFDEWVDSCLSPISGDDSFGMDAKYESEYMAAKEEIDKVTSGSAADWESLADNCIALLSKKTKDLNISGYLCLAWFKSMGYEGLCHGLRIYGGILKEFDYFPKKKKEAKTQKMRSAAVSWLNLRMADFLEITPPGSDEKETAGVIDGYEQLRSIQDIVGESLRPPPSLGRFVQVLGNYRSDAVDRMGNLQSEPAAVPEPEPEEKNEEPEPVSQVASPPTAASVEAASAQVALPSMEGAGENPVPALVSMAGAIRENNPADPLSYKLLRVAKWTGITQIPPADSQGKTRIPAPRPQAMSSVKNTFDSSDPLVAVRMCEGAFSDYGLWWLDLQRGVIQALERAGAGFDEARKAAEVELTNFLARFPDVSGLQFSDGTPFADDDTLALLETLLPEPASMGAVPSAVDEDLGDVFNSATEMASKKDLVGALTLLQSRVVGNSDHRQLFQLRLQAGVLCLKYGRSTEAVVILEDLYEQASSIHLRQWDAGIYLQLCLALDRAYRKQGNETEIELQRRIQEEILRLDLGYALTGK